MLAEDTYGPYERGYKKMCRHATELADQNGDLAAEINDLQEEVDQLDRSLELQEELTQKSENEVDNLRKQLMVEKARRGLKRRIG